MDKANIMSVPHACSAQFTLQTPTHRNFRILSRRPCELDIRTRGGKISFTANSHKQHLWMSPSIFGRYMRFVSVCLAVLWT